MTKVVLLLALLLPLLVPALPSNLSPYDPTFRNGQPLLGGNKTWLDDHPAARLDPKYQHSLKEISLCFFGVPGVRRGKAGVAEKQASISRARAASKATQTASAAAEAARNHLRFIVEPVEQASGATVNIYAHAWMNAGAVEAGIGAALDRTYAERLMQTKYEPYRFEHHTLSMVASMRAVLDLASANSSASSSSLSSSSPSAITILVRHDCFFFRALDVASLSLSPRGVIYTATWCETALLPWCERLRRGRTSSQIYSLKECGWLTLTRFRGVHDYWFIAEAGVLKAFTASLQARIASSNDRPANDRAHFVMEEHATSLRLLDEPTRWQSHPNAISYIDFTLYRWRSYRLEWSSLGRRIAARGHLQNTSFNYGSAKDAVSSSAASAAGYCGLANVCFSKKKQKN
jgi:hypothetical protein